MTTRTRAIATGVAQWGRTSARAIRRDGAGGVRESARTFYTGLWRLYGLANNYGTPVYERGWDLLIVLDACRADLLAEIADDYAFLGRETAASVGSCSPEWMEKNFVEAYADEMARTAYVTGNPYSQSCVEAEEFGLLDEVWRYGWDDDLGTIPPDAITDRAIRIGRERDPDRMILHYMQPHHPFVPEPLGAGADTDLDGSAFGEKDSVWNRLRRDEIDRETVWRAYRANLEYVLDNVALLLENVDADRAVVTSDHGNALGEHRMYGHPMYAPVEALKRVPWCETVATDEGTHDPDAIAQDKTDEAPAEVDDGVSRKLEHLGYL